MSALRVVLTGGPCAGKTTVLNELSKLGFATVPEAAEILLRKHRFRNSVNFQKKICKLQLKLEEETEPRYGLVFFDRGLPDGIAYMEMINRRIPKLEKLSKGRYDFVFVLDRLPFRSEGIRIESGDDEAEELHNRIINVYKRLNYTVFNVPVAPPKDRVRFILSKLGVYRRA